MGQKVNPSLFNKQLSNPSSWSLVSDNEYPLLLKHQYDIESNIRKLFEQNRFLVKDCFFLVGDTCHKPTLFLSFLSLNHNSSGLSGPKALLSVKLKVLLKSLSFRTDFRLIFLNLSQSSKSFLKRVKKTPDLSLLTSFKTESFFKTGLVVFSLLLFQKDTSYLLASFISFYFKALLKTRKLSRFLIFVEKLLVVLVSTKGTVIRGIKVQFKGRLNGSTRTKTRVIESGRLSTQTVSSLSSYSFIPIHTSLGSFGLKIWITYL